MKAPRKRKGAVVLTFIPRPFRKSPLFLAIERGRAVISLRATDQVIPAIAAIEAEQRAFLRSVVDGAYTDHGYAAPLQALNLGLDLETQATATVLQLRQIGAPPPPEPTLAKVIDLAAARRARA